MPNAQTWYAGQLQSATLPIASHDIGLLYGATVFTTLRVYDQCLDHPLTNWSAHCDRIQKSIQFFQQICDWQEPNWPQVEQGARAIAANHPVMRVTLFPNGLELITGRSLPADLSTWQQKGITAWVAEDAIYQRWLPDHKTGNYLPAWLALQAARQQGATEAILTDDQGHWIESSTGNLWGWKDGCWWIPPLKSGILPGIARSQLLHWLRSHHQTVKEMPWTPDWVQALEAVVYSNSVMEIVPIRQILRNQDCYVYDPKHPQIQTLRNLYLHYSDGST